MRLYFVLIQVHADGTKIRRSVSKPLAEMSKEHQDSLKMRFIYAVSFLQCLSVTKIKLFVFRPHRICVAYRCDLLLAMFMVCESVCLSVGHADVL